MLSRRRFAHLVGLAGAAGALAGPRAAIPAAPARKARPATVKPRRLAAGDRVGLVLPASQAFEASTIDLAKQQLEAIGFEVRVGEHARQRHGYFAGTDAERAADLNAMFAASDVAGIFCYTGGWGTPRLLPLLDFGVIRANPKVFVGYSDVTTLLNAIHQETGLVTFHGPMASGAIRPWTLENMKRVLMAAGTIGTLANPPKGDDELVARDYRIVTMRGGKARGRLVGGNLTMLASLMGTPWEVDTEGAILLLEDVNEAFYRIDRMLTQLRLGGKLDRLAGVAFGYCSECPTDAPSFSLEEILDEFFRPLGVPACAGLAFGHIKEKLTLPIGLEATLDADAGTLTIDQAAVI
ncbi:MAG TPA: LD-carboxypeptidase [Kofleriaceae bacterium]|jgi:muramoyltetrapeptide carboxypeptidase